jgi:hypothetical protein
MGAMKEKLMDIEEKILQMESIILELKRDLEFCSSTKKENQNLKILLKIETSLSKIKENLNL